jgi:hypothetical protein
MTKKELEEQLMKMPELEEGTKYTQTPAVKPGAMILEELKEQEQEEEIGACQPELIHKRMNDINTFQAHENEVYLRGTDEYGKDFQICFDSYNFLEWIDTEHLEYIKEQLVKHIKLK